MFGSKRLAGHFFACFFASFFVLTASLHIAVYIQNGNITEQIVSVTLVHIFIVYVALNVRTYIDLDVRINPYITTVEWLLNVPALKGRYYFAPYFIEILAQALAAVFASALTYATFATSPDYDLNTSTIITQSPGWTFALEIAGSSFLRCQRKLYYRVCRMDFLRGSSCGNTSGLCCGPDNPPNSSAQKE